MTFVFSDGVTYPGFKHYSLEPNEEKPFPEVRGTTIKVGIEGSVSSLEVYENTCNPPTSCISKRLFAIGVAPKDDKK